MHVIPRYRSLRILRWKIDRLKATAWRRKFALPVAASAM
jgi:hypothetical protein